MKTKINDLREHLFATLEALRDEDNPMDLARAKAIADVSQTIINTAKVEVDYINATGQTPPSGFIPVEGEADKAPIKPRLVKQ